MCLNTVACQALTQRPGSFGSGGVDYGQMLIAKECSFGNNIAQFPIRMLDVISKINKKPPQDEDGLSIQLFLFQFDDIITIISLVRRMM